MAIELLLKEKDILKKPWVLFILGVVFSSVGIIFSWAIFKEHASIVMVIFSIIPFVPLFVRLIEKQEHKLLKKKLAIHKLVFLQFFFLFLGFCFAFSLWYFILPEPIDTMLFETQIESIYDLDGPFGFAIAEGKERFEGACDRENINQIPENVDFDICLRADYNKNGIDESVLIKNDEPMYVMTEHQKIYPYKIFLVRHIFLNNFWVMFFIYLTSFTFGAGSLFIISWNASIVGVFIGNGIKQTTNNILGVPLFNYVIEFPKIFLPLLVHGIFEFTGFFSSAIAGGILSVAVIRHSLKSKEFITVLKDSLQIMLFAVIMILVGAVLEIYV